MENDVAVQRTPKRDTSAAREASRRTFAKRRAERARAELEMQGYLVVPPAVDDPLPDDPALVDAWGRGYHAGWRQGYRDGLAG